MENFQSNANAKYLLWIASICQCRRLKSCVHAKPLSTTFWSKIANVPIVNCLYLSCLREMMPWYGVCGILNSCYFFSISKYVLSFEAQFRMANALYFMFHYTCGACVCAYVINNCKTIKPYMHFVHDTWMCFYGLCVLRQNIPTTETTNDNIWNLT